MYVEVKTEHAIPWTSPEEYRYDSQNPAGKLRNVDGKTAVAFVDGSVRRVMVDEPKETWNALCTRNGAEVVQLK